MISILMPVKNAGEYLDQCLDSILHQSYDNWELIAVDDGSTDKSLEIMGKYEDLDERILVLNNPDEGIISALQFAFDHSKGSLISRMDADDIMPANKLEILYEQLDERKKVVATGKVRYFADYKVSEGYKRYETWLNTVIQEKEFKTNLYRECIVASPNWLVHRECFEKDFSISSLTYPEDYDMVFQWMKHGYEIDSVNRITHLWREHAKRTSRNSQHYNQASFFRLKTARFIENFSHQMDGVQLIGKGDKGKLIAGILEERNIPFKWFDLKPTGDKQSSVLDLEPTFTILSNWPLEEKTRDDMTEFLKKKQLKFGDNLWLF